MTVLEQLAEFIETADNRHTYNKWLSDDLMEVYVRYGHHVINGEIRNCLDVASVNVFEQRQGTWTKFIWKAHAMNPWEYTFIECVHNEYLSSWLTKNGFTSDGGSPGSYYLPTSKT